MHGPDQFSENLILDVKTYTNQFVDCMKQVVRDLGARAEGSKEKRDELHREIAEVKGVILTKKTRAKSNGEAPGAEQT